VRKPLAVSRKLWMAKEPRKNSARGSRLTAHEDGYTMVAIVLGMMILAIVIMGVAPAVATVMKREREKELLFRGKQYARAIALFQKRYGRFPTELKELYENRPRTIRKLWKEPMCNCPDWHVIYQNSPDALNPGGGGSGLPGIDASNPFAERPIEAGIHQIEIQIELVVQPIIETGVGHVIGRSVVKTPAERDDSRVLEQRDEIRCRA